MTALRLLSVIGSPSVHARLDRVASLVPRGQPALEGIDVLRVSALLYHLERHPGALFLGGSGAVQDKGRAVLGQLVDARRHLLLRQGYGTRGVLHTVGRGRPRVI